MSTVFFHASEHILKCKCGSFEARFNCPPRITFDCHCHSCVAVIKAIEAKDGFDGISAKSDAESGGAAVAIYKSNSVTVEKIDGSKIGFMKVGPDGKTARPYCTECGTVLFNVWAPNWCAANRNALTKGEAPYEPKKKPVGVNCKHAFDKSKIPDPKVDTIPAATLLKFIPLLAGSVNPMCDGSNAKEKGLFPEDMSTVEFVNITWEEETKEETKKEETKEEKAEETKEEAKEEETKEAEK